MLYLFEDHSGQYGYINSEGEIVIKPCCSFAFQFSDGLAGAYFVYKTKSFFGKEKEKTEFVYFNTRGEIAIRNKYVTTGNSFFEGLAMVFIEKVQKWGFIDASGVIVIAPQFDKEYSSGFSEGLVDVCKNDKWGYINSEGDQVTPFDFDWTNQFHDGFAIVRRKKRKFFVNRYGEKLKTVKCSILDTVNGGFKEGLAVVKVGEKYGVINTSGDLVIDPIYDGMMGFSDGVCSVNFNGKTGFINKNGEFVIEPFLFTSTYFHNNIAPAAEKKGRWGLIDKNGEFLSTSRFDFINDFTRIGSGYSLRDKCKLTTAQIGKNEYYIDFQGTIVSKTKDISKLKEQRERRMLENLTKKVIKEDIWDKAEWVYDGLTISKEGAIKPIYFVLKWLKSMNLLTPEGIDCYQNKNNLKIGLYRFMVTKEGADFLDRYYKLWFETESIANFQIDPSLKFEEDENLTEYWNFYINNKK